MSETDEYDFSGVVLGPVSSSSGSDPTLGQEDTDDEDEDIEMFWSGSLPYDITEKLIEINRAFVEDDTPMHSDRPKKVKFNNRVRVRDISMHRLNTYGDETDSTDNGELSDTAALESDENTKVLHKIPGPHIYASVHEKAILTDSPRLFAQERELRNTTILNSENKRSNNTTSTAGKLQRNPIKSQTVPSPVFTAKNITSTSSNPSGKIESESEPANEPTKSSNKIKFNSDFSDAQNSLCLENVSISESASLTGFISMYKSSDHNPVISCKKSKLNSNNQFHDIFNGDSEFNSHEICLQISHNKYPSVPNEELFDKVLSEGNCTADKSSSCGQLAMRSTSDETADSDSDPDLVTNSDQPFDAPNSIDKSEHDMNENNLSELADSNQSEFNLYDFSSDTSDVIDDHGTDLDKFDDGALTDTETISDKCPPKLKHYTQSSQDSAISSIEDNGGRVGRWCGQSAAGACGDTSRHKPSSAAETVDRAREERTRSSFNYRQTSISDSNNNSNDKTSKHSGINSAGSRSSCRTCRSSNGSAKSGGNAAVITGTACNLHHRSSYQEALQAKKLCARIIQPKESQDSLYLWRKRCRNLTRENEGNSSVTPRPTTKDTASEQHTRPRDSGAYQFWLRKKNQQQKLEKQITKLKQSPIGGCLASPSRNLCRGVSCERIEYGCDRSRDQTRQRPGYIRSLSHHQYERTPHHPAKSDHSKPPVLISSSEKRSQCDQVFQIWLQKKRDEQRLKHRIECLQQEILTASTPPRDPQRAYAEWLQVKKQECAGRPSSASTMRGRANYLRARDVYAPDVFNISPGRRGYHRTR